MPHGLGRKQGNPDDKHDTIRRWFNDSAVFRPVRTGGIALLNKYDACKITPSPPTQTTKSIYTASLHHNRMFVMTVDSAQDAVAGQLCEGGVSKGVHLFEATKETPQWCTCPSPLL